MSRTFLLQDWVTIRGTNGTLTPFTQDEERWLDLTGYSDVTCWIDVMEVTPPATNNYVTVTLETAAVCDDLYFAASAPSVNFGAVSQYNVASTSPVIIRSTRAANASNLMRYLRWKITPSTTGLWDLTFRIRAVATRSDAFSPLDISGCKLWLRADMGITLGSAGIGASVGAWGDQSGNGVSVSQSTGSKQPTYNVGTTGILGGMPTLNFNQGSLQILSSSPTTYSNSGAASIFSAVSRAAAGSFLNTRIFETLNSNGYYLGTGGAGGPNWRAIVNNTFGSLGGNSGNGDTLVSLNYDGSGGRLYQNGVQVAPAPPGSDAFPTPGLVSNPYTIGGFLGGGTTTDFWNGHIAEVLFYNRNMSPAELTRIHRYLGARYNIAVP